MAQTGRNRLLGRAVALAVGLGSLGACATSDLGLTPSGGETATMPRPSPDPTVATASESTVLAGTAYAPMAIAVAGSPVRFASTPASGSLIYVSTSAEAIYLGPAGAAIATTADDQGRFKLRVAPGKPLLVSAVLAGNRRLVGLANIAATGSATIEISLESTYATECLRRYAARAGRSPGDYDLGSLSAIGALTRDMLDRGELAADPDLSPAAIPDLVDTYLIAMATAGRKDLSDSWARLLGERPLAVTTLEDAVPDGFTPTALAVDPASGDIFVASFNTTGVAIGRAGDGTPLFRALAADGFLQIVAMAPGPDGRIYFAERVDRSLGGAVARSGASAEIRLFRFQPAHSQLGRQPVPDEIRLQVPPELSAYMADAGRFTHIEPSGLAWNAGKLYLSDIETGLIYEFQPLADLATGSAWPGQVHAGRVTGGRPDPGDATGPRRAGAAFNGITSLVWYSGELLFSDGENAVVRAIDGAGTVRDVAGRAGVRGNAMDGLVPLAASFDYPQGLAGDAAGRLFIADGDNHRIRILDGGRVRTVAGGGVRAGDGDAREIAFGQITRLAFDAQGNLLFNDVEAAKVRRLWLQHGI